MVDAGALGLFLFFEGFLHSFAAGRILAVVHQVLSAVDRVGPARYQLVLTPKPEPVRQGGEIPASRSAERWPGDTALAA